MMRSPHDEALALLARAPYVHLASTTREGAPLLRAVHGAVCDGMLCFHGSPVGEKTEAEGRPAVIGYEELVAEIPSYWTDAEMAWKMSGTRQYQDLAVRSFYLTNADAKQT